jgi:hypothetical protein
MIPTSEQDEQKEQNIVLITDYIRAAVAGATVDGRDISDQAIEDMATTYHPDTYNARIWPEHIRGIAPDGMFKALGDVVQAKAERIKGGALAGKLALYVKIAPHQDLIAMVRNGQKVHLSIEAQPNFANTGKTYLVGVGVTDSPASLGTGIMKFSTAERHENIFSTPQETPIQLPQEHTMNREDFKQLLAESLNPLVEKLNTQSDELKSLKEKQDEIIQLATPPAGNGRHYGDREPHNGGDSGRRRNIY